MTLRDEPVSSRQMLASLDLAIYAAELVRSFVQSENKSEKLKTGKSAAHRLSLLNREILLLKAKQSRLLGAVNSQ